MLSYKISRACRIVNIYGKLGGKKETWNVKCEVIDISPKTFKEAVTYYNPYQNKLT